MESPVWVIQIEITVLYSDSIFGYIQMEIAISYSDSTFGYIKFFPISTSKVFACTKHKSK